jgi:membrane associated rhomboid family serine protease
MSIYRRIQLAKSQTRFSLVNLIVVLNVLVFLAWRLSSEEYLEWMAANFLVSWAHLQDSRFWTLLTSVFSHNMFWHLLINMLVLKNFGPILEKVLGKKSFFNFYISAGIISSFCHAAVSAWILNQPQLPALGASGAISGLVLLFAFIFPKEKILILGIIPMPALVGALVFVGIDIWGLIGQAEGGGLPIGHAAHLGGAMTGIFYYYFYLRPRIINREN